MPSHDNFKMKVCHMTPAGEEPAGPLALTSPQDAHPPAFW